jgi:hypothetical protein
MPVIVLWYRDVLRLFSVHVIAYNARTPRALRIAYKALVRPLLEYRTAHRCGIPLPRVPPGRSSVFREEVLEWQTMPMGETSV